MWAHAVQVCRLSACVAVLFYPHCPGRGTAVYPISSRDLWRDEFKKINNEPTAIKKIVPQLRRLLSLRPFHLY